MKKEIVLWGAGEMCKNFLSNNSKDNIAYIIDSDIRKKNQCISGIRVVLPEDIKNWNNIFVIITTQYFAEIKTILENKGLIYKIDFIEIQSLYLQPVDMKIIKNTMENIFLKDDSLKKGVEIKIFSKDEYDYLVEKLSDMISFENAMSQIYYNLPGKIGSYNGYCSVCNEETEFYVDFYWSKTKEPLWRETITCSKCNCNSRMRFMIEYIKKNFINNKIFIYERITNTYAELSKCIKEIVGSEYLSSDYKSGEVVNGIMHQDATMLSFEDNTFNLVVSNDVFEHVSDFKQSLREAYRCLKPGGKLVFSIPIFLDRKNNVIRAKQSKNNEIINILKPIYHGNPLSKDGSLVYTEFGWEIIENLKECGFKDAYAIAYTSSEKGYLGKVPVIFEAEK